MKLMIRGDLDQPLQLNVYRVSKGFVAHHRDDLTKPERRNTQSYPG